MSRSVSRSPPGLCFPREAEEVSYANSNEEVPEQLQASVSVTAEKESS